jgi:putative membrane protein
MRLILRWLITAVSLWVAVAVLPGMRIEGDAPLYVAATALILGLVNAFVRPILKLLSCPFILLTLGLFLLVINGITLWLSAALAKLLDIPFYIDGFWWAVAGGLIMSVVSAVLTMFLPDRER